MWLEVAALHFVIAQLSEYDCISQKCQGLKLPDVFPLSLSWGNSAWSVVLLRAIVYGSRSNQILSLIF